MEMTDLMKEQPTLCRSSIPSKLVGQLPKENKVAGNKMAEQVQQITTKDPEKVEVGNRLAEHNHRKRERMKTQKSQSETNLTYYITGAIITIGVLGIISYYFY